jgi:hypothetical protein
MAAEFAEKIRAWTAPVPYMKAYEQHGWPIFQSEVGAFTCRALLQLPLDDLKPHFVDYLDSLRGRVTCSGSASSSVRRRA